MNFNLGAAFAVATTFLPAMKEAKNGQGVPIAATLANTAVNAVVMNAFAKGGIVGVMLGQIGFSALTAGGGAAVGYGISQLRERPKYNMSIAAPWSSSYQITERASLSMRRGLEAIQGSQSIIGSEASMYAARYSR